MKIYVWVLISWIILINEINEMKSPTKIIFTVVDCLMFYVSAELTDELTKTKIELESSKRSLQTLPHIFPDRNAYVDGLKDKTNELTLSNNQLANENSRLKKENEKLKAENEQQKQKINNMMAGMMQMFFNWQTEL